MPASNFQLYSVIQYVFNKKLLETSATLVVTGALLVGTMFAIRNTWPGPNTFRWMERRSYVANRIIR